MIDNLYYHSDTREFKGMKQCLQKVFNNSSSLRLRMFEIGESFAYYTIGYLVSQMKITRRISCFV